MDYIKRTPNFAVEIRRPNYNLSTYQDESIVTFTSQTGRMINDPILCALTSYGFSESLAAVESNFSLTLTPVVDRDGKTWMDKLEKMDIVYITEWGKVRFCGYVEDIRFSARMTSAGKPQREILVEGGSIGKLLSTFKIILNQAILPGTGTAKSKSDILNGILQATIVEGGSIKNIFGLIYKDFMELMIAIGQSEKIQNQGIYALLDYFIDYENGISKDIEAIYPTSFSLYSVGENNIWDIWDNLAYPPINELFGIWHVNSEKYRIIFRQSPFEPEDWRNLPLTIIPTVALTTYDLGTSTSEVFTFYQAGLPGYNMNDNEAKLLGNYAIDKEKWVKYGYRPMYVQFKYFDKGELKNETDITIKKIMGYVCETLKRWYEHNTEFLSGTAKFMTFDDSRPWPGKNFVVRNPRIGERIGVFDVQFYVENVAHSWTYGGPMETTVQMTRGYRYDSEGKMIGKVDKIGTKLISMKDFDAYWASQLKGET